MELLRTTILVIWAFAAYFVFSECGEMVTSQFEKFNDALDQCSWYLFSIETQKMFAVVVANSQPSINIRGYGNVLCARKSFKTVSIYIFPDCFFSILKIYSFGLVETNFYIWYFYIFRRVKLAFHISQCFDKSMVNALDCVFMEKLWNFNGKWLILKFKSKNNSFYQFNIKNQLSFYHIWNFSLFFYLHTSYLVVL